MGVFQHVAYCGFPFQICNNRRFMTHFYFLCVSAIRKWKTEIRWKEKEIYSHLLNYEIKFKFHSNFISFRFTLGYLIARKRAIRQLQVFPNISTIELLFNISLVIQLCSKLCASLQHRIEFVYGARNRNHFDNCVSSNFSRNSSGLNLIIASDDVMAFAFSLPLVHFSFFLYYL